MGDELKVYIPSMVQPVLRLFMQDDSQQKLVTQKVRIVYIKSLESITTAFTSIINRNDIFLNICTPQIHVQHVQIHVQYILYSE